MEDELILLEGDKAKLDEIVWEMENNGESEEAIKFVVSDFKQKYGRPADEKNGQVDTSVPGAVEPMEQEATEPDQLKKKEDEESSVSNSGSSVSPSPSVLASNNPTLQKYLQETQLTKEEEEEIKSDLNRQKEGDLSIWERAKSFAKGFLQSGGVVATPVLNFDSEEELLEKKRKYNKIEYIENLTEEEQAELLSIAQAEAAPIQEDNQLLYVNLRALEQEMRDIEAFMEPYSNMSGREISRLPKEEIQEFLTAGSKYQELRSTFDVNLDAFEKTSEQVGSFAQEIDLLKRNYGTLDNAAGRIILSTIDILAGVGETAAAINPVLQVLDEVPGATGTEGVSEIMQGVKDFTDNERSYLRPEKEVGDIQSVEDFAEWTTDLVANQLPIIATLVATGGTTGPAILGGSAAGQKSLEMKKEIELGTESYSDMQIFLASAGMGVVETLSERVTGGILSKGKRAFKASVAEAGEDAFQKGVKNWADKTMEAAYKAGDISLDASLEGGSELLAKLGENAINRYGLGKKEVKLTDGLENALASGVMMGTLMNVTPTLAGAMLKPYFKSSSKLNMDELNSKINSITRQLEDQNLDPEVKAEMETVLKDLNSKRKKLWEDTIEDTQNLDPEEIKEVADLDQEIADEKKKAKKIVKNEDIDPEVRDEISKNMLERLKSKQKKKEEILNNDYEVDTKNEAKSELRKYVAKYRRKKRALGRKLDSGKISPAEYSKANAKLNKELSATQKELGVTNKEANIEPRDAKWDEDIKANLPVAESIQGPKELNKVLEGEWAMLTAENPNAEAVSDKSNLENNKKAATWLKKKGYNPIPIFGKYGNSEQSFLVPNMSLKDAVDFARLYDQESVATHKGLVYQNNTMNPYVKKNVGVKDAKDFYSTIKTAEGNVDYQIEYDFDKTVKLTEAEKRGGLYERLDQLDKELTEFGKENLGMNLPVAVAKMVLKTAKAAIIAGKTIQEAIQEAIKKLRNSEWYNILDKQEKAAAEKEVEYLILNTRPRNTPSDPSSLTPTDIKTKLKRIFLSGVPVISYIDEKIFTEYVGKPMEDAITKIIKRGVESRNDIVRNISQTIVAFYNGAARTRGEVKGRRRLQGRQDLAVERGKMLTSELQRLIAHDPESARRVHKVMDAELYEDEADILEFDDLNDNEKELYKLLREINDRTHELNFKEGFIDEKTYKKFKGRYIGRGYEPMQTIDDATFLQEMNNRIFGDMYKKRGEIDEWKVNNKITDPIYLTINRMIQTERNVAVKDYAHSIVDAGLTKDVETPGYKKLSGRSYGPLNGKYVPHHIAEDFIGFWFTTEFVDGLYSLSKVYDKTAYRQFLKRNFTVYNPVVQLGNLSSNFAFAFVSGINPVQLGIEINNALKDIKNKDNDFLKLLEEGIIGSDVITPDLKLSKDTQREMSLLMEDTETQNKLLKEAKGIKNKVGRKIMQADKWARNVYANSDNVMKLAAYKAFIKMGYTHNQAVEKTYEGFQNYATVGKVWDLASKTPIVGPVFIKFQADLQRIVKNAVTKRPLTTASFLALLKVVGIALSEASGESEEERAFRENRPFIPKIEVFDLNIPLVFRAGNKEVNVARFLSPYYNYDVPNKHWLERVSRFMPYQAMVSESVEMGQQQVLPEANDVLLGPFVQAFVYNKDFRQKSVTDPFATRYAESGLTKYDKLINQAVYLGRSVVPLGSFAHDLYLSHNYGEDYYGRSKTLGDLVASKMIKIQTWDDKELKETIVANVNSIEYNARNINNKIKSVERYYNKQVEEYSERLEQGKITKEQFDNKVLKLYEESLDRTLKYQSQLVKEQEKMNKLIQDIDNMGVKDLQ